MTDASHAYKLPANAQEFARLNSQHAAMKLQAKGNYLAQLVGEQCHTIVDLCCGGGQWIMEMALEFPRAKLYGVDVNPPEVLDPPPNCKFLKADVLGSPLPFESDSVSFVQLRTVPTIINDERDYLLSEVARVLHKGGIFQMIEPFEAYSLDAGGYGHRSPRSIEVDTYLVQLPHLHPDASGSGVSTNWSIAPRLHSLMQNHGPGTFSDIHQRNVVLPVGRWPKDPVQKEIAIMMADGWCKLLEGFRRPLIEQSLISEQDFEALSRNLEREINGKDGREWKLCFEFIYVWGAKSL